MATSLIYERIYRKLEKIGVLDVKEYAKFKSTGYMDLSVDVLYENENEKVIAIAHNYVQNGDLMADPDMEIKIHKNLKMAEALTYEQSCFGVYQRVYPEPGKVNIRLKKDLNVFLNSWLGNVIEQGHVPA